MHEHENEFYSGIDESQFLDWFSSPESGDRQVTLSLAQSPLVLLGYTANQYKQATSRIFLKRFGVGGLDWRLLVVLYRNPNISSKMVASNTKVDKAAVSRTLARLEKLGYVNCKADAGDERVKVWLLSTSGIELHNNMLRVSIEIYQRVLSRLDASRIDQFRQTLRVLIESIADLPEELNEMPLPERTKNNEK